MGESKEGLELELGKVQGVERFEVWKKYIKFEEARYNQKEIEYAQLMRVLERCCLDYASSPLLKDDREYLKIWMKYLRACKATSAFQLFPYLEQNQIGVKHALLYRSWAHRIVQEQHDNEAARAVLQRGLQNSAEPRKKLEETLKYMSLLNDPKTASPAPQPLPKATPISTELPQYDASWHTIQGELLSFEESRARVHLERFPFALPEGDTMCLTQNHSNILSLGSEFHDDPLAEEDATFPLVQAARKLNFQEQQQQHSKRAADVRPVVRPDENAFDQTLEAFFASGTTVQTHENTLKTVKPPSTPTMTMNTRAALAEILPMFSDTSGERLETIVEHDQQPRQDNLTLPHVDPFHPEERNRILNETGSMDVVLHSERTFDHRSVTAPDEVEQIEEDGTIELDNVDLMVLSLKSSTVVEVQNLSADNEDEGNLCLKLLRPAQLWWPYVSTLLQSRLEDRMARMRHFYLFEDCTLVLEPFADLGSLQQALDVFQRKGNRFSMELVLFLSRKILGLMGSYHEQSLVHGCIQPKHLLAFDDFNELVLNDFHDSVDLAHYERNVLFATVHSSLPCLKGKSLFVSGPQLDAFGAASTLHWMLFGRDLSVQCGSQNTWELICDPLEETSAAPVLELLFSTLEQYKPSLQRLMLQRIDAFFQDDPQRSQQLRVSLCDLSLALNSC